MNITFAELPRNLALNFDYQFFKTPAGNVLIVSWQKNIVYVAFADSQKSALAEVQKKFPKVKLTKKGNLIQKQLFAYFTQPKKIRKVIFLAVQGTTFQMLVWKTLLKIPYGKRWTYSELAKRVGKPSAVRAVASAVAKNPIALLIPCHRVVPKSGGIGQYHWGAKHKKNLLAWEQKSK